MVSPAAARGETPTPFSCDPAQSPAELPLRRLSRVEYVNTVSAFARAALAQSAASALGAFEGQLDVVPADTVVKVNGETHGGFSRLDQTAQQATVDATYAVSVALAQQATHPPARLTELMGTCATDASKTNDASCLASLVDKLGPLAVRHALSAEDRAFFIATAGATPVDPDAVADVLAVMTASPAFLYHLESGDQPIEGNRYALDAFELASRLSYHFWQAPQSAPTIGSSAGGEASKANSGWARTTRRRFRAK